MDFKNQYVRLCADPKHSGPLPAVLKHLRDELLVVDADRLLPEEMVPILLALNRDKHLVGVRISVSAQAGAGPRKVALHDFDLSARLVRSVCSTLAISLQLKTLELPGLRFSVNGLRLIAKALARSATIKRLSLRETLIGDEGFGALVPGLLENESLVDLDLASCSLTDLSGRRVADLLLAQSQPDFPTEGLRFVDLSSNGFADDSADAFAAALAAKTNLSVLNLRRNRLSTDGVEALLHAGDHRAGLTLELRDNPGSYPDGTLPSEMTDAPHHSSAASLHAAPQPPATSGPRHPSVPRLPSAASGTATTRSSSSGGGGGASAGGASAGGAGAGASSGSATRTLGSFRELLSRSTRHSVSAESPLLSSPQLDDVIRSQLADIQELKRQHQRILQAQAEAHSGVGWVADDMAARAMQEKYERLIDDLLQRFKQEMFEKRQMEKEVIELQKQNRSLRAKFIALLGNSSSTAEALTPRTSALLRTAVADAPNGAEGEAESY